MHFMICAILYYIFDSIEGLFFTLWLFISSSYMHHKHSFPIVGIYMPHYLIHILKINQDKPSIIILHILISVAIGITL